jgi:3-hydroxyacyl-CoA dehydrogenase
MVKYERDGEIGVIGIDNPPVNALSQPVRRKLIEALKAALADLEAKAIVLLGEGRLFSAGADISEFGSPEAAADPSLPSVISEFDASTKPVVAVIHGTALGGALELALGCNYRVGLAKAKLGLPEVKLGILPGAGGTQRLPRVVGVRAALELITSGNIIAAKEALDIGILDAVEDASSAREAGIRFAQRLIDQRLPLARVRDRTDKIAEASEQPDLFEEFRKRIASRAKGQTSPLACIDAIEAAVTLPFEEGLARELDLCNRLHQTRQHRALVHAFFGVREATKIPGLSKDSKPRKVERAAIIGAGTMGGGIAMCFADSGIPVTIVEHAQEALDRGVARIRDNYEKSAARGRISQEVMRQRMDLISTSLKFEDIAQADIVIEAVFEKMDVKKDIFRRIDQIAKPGALLATNTSYLDVNEIAAETGRVSDVLGMHFFSPANVMKLLEIVRTEKCSDTALKTALAVGAAIGKVCVVAGVCDGFLGNRMYKAYQRQTFYMMEDGALPHEIDAALIDFGFAMGPLAVGDLTGNDVDYLNRRREDALRDPNERYVHLADKIVEMGRHGQKTGAGWYRYGTDGRTPLRDPEIEKLIASESQRKGIARRNISPDEIRTRALAALVNEGAKILEEEIAIRSSDIDVAWINGYGFPAHEGGPMFWADEYGLRDLLAKIKEFEKGDPHSWRPAPLLLKLADRGGSFQQWSAENYARIDSKAR